MTIDELWTALDEAQFITGAWTGLTLDELPDKEVEKFQAIYEQVIAGSLPKTSSVRLAGTLTRAPSS